MKVYLLDMFERILGMLEVEAFTTANQNEEDVERELELIPLNVRNRLQESRHFLQFDADFGRASWGLKKKTWAVSDHLNAQTKLLLTIYTITLVVIFLPLFSVRFL